MQDIYLFSRTFRPAPGPIQPPVQWVLGIKKRQGVKLTDHTPAFSARLRMNAAIPLHRHRHSGVHRDIYLQIKFQVRPATRAKWQWLNSTIPVPVQTVQCMCFHKIWVYFDLASQFSTKCRSYPHRTVATITYDIFTRRNLINHRFLGTQLLFCILWVLKGFSEITLAAHGNLPPSADSTCCTTCR